MIDLGCSGAEICVVGRTSFQSGIGSIGFGTAEALARCFPISFLPTEAAARERDAIVLPNGRNLPVCKDPGGIKVSFFCDVLWNGAADRNYELTPPGSLKYAWLVFDSDRLPERWVQLLNRHFDLVVAASPHLVATARRSGVETPVACAPIPLDLDGLLAQPLAMREPGKIRFGSVAAFHPRKGHETLVEAFLSRFADRADVELVLHSNLAFGATLDRVKALVARYGAKNVTITHGALSELEKNQLVRSFDIFVSCSRGEGYNIGAREALACGSVVVASQVGAHQDLAGPPGVFLVAPDLRLPARYPEIDNGIFGHQEAVCPTAMAEALESALSFVERDPDCCTAQDRRNWAREWSISRLAGSMGSLIDPAIRRRPSVVAPPEFDQLVETRVGRRADAITSLRRQVCAAEDVGFLSVFNSFMDRLVWQEREDRCHAVLPDWDVDRLKLGLGRDPTNFCYGQPGDGNLWLKLFEPLWGATEAEMQDEAWLWRHAAAPAPGDPALTHKHPRKPYQDPDFAAWRQQYNRVFRENVRLRPELIAEIESFVQSRLNEPVLIAAHIPGSSCSVDRPDLEAERSDALIAQIRAHVRERGVDPDTGQWAVFVATDREVVLRRFRHAFGDKVVFYEDVRRTGLGRQLSFGVAPISRETKGDPARSAPATSHWRLAWEVLRDACTMARCQCMLHADCEASTTASYLNPGLQMCLCSA